MLGLSALGVMYVVETRWLGQYNQQRIGALEVERVPAVKMENPKYFTVEHHNYNGQEGK